MSEMQKRIDRIQWYHEFDFGNGLRAEVKTPDAKSHRALWHLIFAAVFERHPTLKFILTEQGTGWIPNGLASLDWFMGRMKKVGSAESMETM